MVSSNSRVCPWGLACPVDSRGRCLRQLYDRSRNTESIFTKAYCVARFPQQRKTPPASAKPTEGPLCCSKRSMTQREQAVDRARGATIYTDCSAVRKRAKALHTAIVTKGRAACQVLLHIHRQEAYPDAVTFSVPERVGS